MHRSWIAARPSDTRGIGIDDGTALVGQPGGWHMPGQGQVPVIEAGAECARRVHRGGLLCSQRAWVRRLQSASRLGVPVRLRALIRLIWGRKQASYTGVV